MRDGLLYVLKASSEVKDYCFINLISLKDTQY